MSILELEQLIGQTPLVRLRHMTDAASVQVLVKLEGNNPAGSVKDRPALNMIMGAERSGTLHPGDSLIEATSGNTGIALAMAAAVRGYHMILIMPDHMSSERIGLMKSYGAEVILVSRNAGMEGARDLAQEMVQRKQGKILDQFSNPYNPQAHFQTTGPEIWRDTAGKVTHFVSAMGTTGTIMGVSRFLKACNNAIEIIGVQPAGDDSIPGIRRWPEAYLPKIYEPHRVDRVVGVSAEQARITTMALAKKEGLSVGLSAGGAIHIALEQAKILDQACIVVIASDRGDRYLSTGLFKP